MTITVLLRKRRKIINIQYDESEVEHLQSGFVQGRRGACGGDHGRRGGREERVPSNGQRQ